MIKKIIKWLNIWAVTTLYTGNIFGFILWKEIKWKILKA